MTTSCATEALLKQILACRHCQQVGLIDEARPILQWGQAARIGGFGQAPGMRAHLANKPFWDPSGDRLREWQRISGRFYDASVFAIIPMGFCFPGYDARGANKPPLAICAERWRASLMMHLKRQLDLILLVGRYSQQWHLPEWRRQSLTEVVSNWRSGAGSYTLNCGPKCCRSHIPPGVTMPG